MVYLKQMRRSIYPVASILGIALALTACTPVRATRGQFLKPEQIESLKPGLTKAEIAASIGSPTTQSTFDEHEWYYVGESTKQKAFYKPEVKARSVVVLTFDDEEKLQTVKTLSEKDGQKITMNKEVTKTSGQDYTILQQLLGNVGRFSGQGSK